MSPVEDMLTEALLDLTGSMLPNLPHRDHNYVHGCPMCNGDVPAIAAGLAPAVQRHIDAIVARIQDEIIEAIVAQLKADGAS